MTTPVPCRCPSCGRVWAAWPTLPGDPLPRHRAKRSATWCTATVTAMQDSGPDIVRPATVLDAAHEYADDAAKRAEDYRYLASVCRLAMAAPLRGELSGDVADLVWWDARAAVWSQRALWVRAAIGGGL
jgi:hypothetical protein